MKIINELWDELGYAEMNLTNQNLRDQAARLERRTRNVSETIVETFGCWDMESIPEIIESAERINNEEQPTLAPNTESFDLRNTPSMQGSSLELGPIQITNMEMQSIY